jgi:hypothetical protein
MSTRSRPRYPIKWSAKRSDRLIYRERVTDECFAWVLESVWTQRGCPNRPGRNVFIATDSFSIDVTVTWLSLMLPLSVFLPFRIPRLLPFYVHFLLSLFIYFFVVSSFSYFIASAREPFSSFYLSQSPYFLPSVFIPYFLTFSVL